MSNLPYIRITSLGLAGWSTKVEAVLQDGTVVSLDGFVQSLEFSTAADDANRCTLVCQLAKAEELKALLSETSVKFVDEEIEQKDGIVVHRS